MELFKGTNLIDFIDRFENEENAKSIWQKLSGPMALPVVNVAIPIIGPTKRILL